MKAKIWAAMLALYIAWGTTYLAISYAIDSIPPFFMSGMRFLGAGLILYIWRRLAGDPAPNRAQWRFAGIVGTFLLVGGIGGLGLAEKYVPSGIAALIVAATPLWVVILEALPPRKIRPTFSSGLGVLVGVMGIFMLVNPMSSTTRGGYNLFGVFLLILGSLSWAIGTILIHGAKKSDMPSSSLLGTGMQLLAGSAGSFIIGLVTGEASKFQLSLINPHSWLGLGYLIVVGSLVGFVCYTWLLRVAPTSMVVTYAYVNPLIAVLLGGWLAQEMISPRVFIAGPLILVAVFLIHAKYGKPRQVEPRWKPVIQSAGDD